MNILGNRVSKCMSLTAKNSCIYAQFSNGFSVTSVKIDSFSNYACRDRMARNSVL